MTARFDSVADNQALRALTGSFFGELLSTLKHQSDDVAKIAPDITTATVGISDRELTHEITTADSYPRTIAVSFAASPVVHLVMACRPK